MTKKITTDALARMTQNQFSEIDKRLDGVDASLTELKEGQRELKEGQQKLQAGQERIMDVLLEIPSKKAFERYDSKVDAIDARLTSIERNASNR